MARPKLDSVFCDKPIGLGALERIINLISFFVVNASFSLNDTLYGKSREVQKPTEKSKSKKKNPIDRALDRGIIPILDEISSVDFCNLTTYLISRARGSGFNPNERPDSGIALQIWSIQNEAYKLQLKIDNNLGEISDVLTPDARLRLTDLLLAISDTVNNKISSNVDKFIEEVKLQNGDNIDELNKTVKRLLYLKLILSTSAEVLETLGSNVNIGNAQKAVNTINKVRATLILIQGISNPASALTLLNQFTGNAIQDQFNRINRLIPVDQLIPLLKKILRLSNNINSIGQKVIGQIKTIQFFVKIAVTIIKVLNIIRLFFLFGFQLPNLFTTVSVTSTASNIVEEKINQKGIKKLEERLQQINYTLCIIINFCTFLVANINEILIRLRAILLNIESCQNIDDSVKQDLINTISTLSSTRDELQKFLNAVNSPVNQPVNTFGEYTIEIVTEQVVDEAINLKRRFGIARGKNNIIAVQSTPTFASLDLIIINEVKALLVAQGLVNVGSLGLSNETLLTISESLRAVEDQSVTIDDLESPTILDFKDLQSGNSEEALGLQSFVNNLPGGKALKNRVRNKLIKSNEKLIQNLKTADPSSTGTEKIIKQKEAETNKLRIEKLEDEKASLQKLLLLSAANPLGAAAIIVKIKSIDNEIKDLKNKLK